MAGNNKFKKVRKTLEEAGIKFVRILWCDNANVIRGKAVHLNLLDREYFDYGVGISAGQQGVPVMYDGVIAETGLSPVGEVRLVPDWSTLKILPYTLAHASVMGNMILKGEPWAMCPRNFLIKTIAAAKSQGLTVKAAFENEFYLLRQTTNGLKPADETPFASTQAMDIHWEVINEIADALIAQGIPVEQYYPESGPGQQEISIRYSDALAAADRQITFRETVRAIAHQHDLAASFFPKIFPDAAGSGCHIHFSIWQDEQNLLPDKQGICGLSQTAREFVAGILHHLPSLMALTTPSVNSYRRLLPHCWSGAYRCWGLDNREAAVRVPSNPAGCPTHFELKTVDASANPYLALGSAIAAGLDGVQKNLEAPNPVTVDPGNLTPEERSSQGIDQHGHNLLRPEIAADYPYTAVFTQGYDPEIINHHARHTLFYRRSLKEIATLLECEAEESSILSCRESLGWEQLCQICFNSGNIEAIYLDDGLQPDDILPLSSHERFVKVKRVLRLEILAEQLILQTKDFAIFLTRFLQEIDPPPAGVIAFKSIVCYRTGLEIDTVTTEVASDRFNYLQQQLTDGESLRLVDKSLIDFLLQQALLVAAKYRLPVQFHTGFGDPDLDLRLANPLLLRPLLESPQYRQVPFVLLHAAYPYMREAGYLASVYPQVYLDFGLAIPFLSFSGMRNTLRQLLELTPTSKLMYSSDAKFIPELYYLAAKWGRQIVAEVLEEAIADGELTATEAEIIASAILRQNALDLYH